MNEQYPDNLFSAVAQNILAKHNGQPATATIQKEANDKTLEDYQKEYDTAFAPPSGGYKTVAYTRDEHDPDRYRGISTGLGGLAGAVGGALLGKKFGKEPTAPFESGLVGGVLGAMGGHFVVPSLLPDRLKTKVETHSYQMPNYSPEQQEARRQIYDDKNNIIDQFGKRLLEQGQYDGPDFEGLFENPGYLTDSHYQEMIKRYPRLLDAMKQDSREDRGGILWHYQQSLDNLKNSPEAQTKLYDYLQKALDNKYFYGWKWPFETPQEVDQTTQELDQRLKQASAPVRGLAKLADDQQYAQPIGYYPYTIEHGGNKWLSTSLLAGLGAGGGLGALIGKKITGRPAGAAIGSIMGLGAGIPAGGVFHDLAIRPHLNITKERHQMPVYADDAENIDPTVWPYATPSDLYNGENWIPVKQASNSIAGLAKLAAVDDSLTPDQAGEMNQFLSQYNFTPAQFAGDPVANKAIDPQEVAAMRKLKAAFQSQAQMLGGMTPELAKNRELAMQNIRSHAHQARIDTSIENTMNLAGKDPEQFGQMVDLSNRSQAALQHSKADLIGALSGGGIGGLIGLFGGKGLVGKGVAGATGALAGGAAGHLLGRDYEEKQTGYAHRDVLRPYQVADRMTRRNNADLRS